MTEETIFAAAVEKSSPAERAAYLDSACGDNVELRNSVEALLASHDAQSNVLDRPPVAAAATIEAPAQVEATIAEGPGARIGNYRLMEQIGEGGFGLVFVAEQQQPVQRKVALKVIKPGMDTRDVIARFEAERQALALMDHPNIARVFDAGATVSGRPYFVMELVRGVPISQYCDQNQLTPRERLELFVSVCLAVQHAHQKGIIHRDLKPSNVLVTLHDSRPVVKVIDFGVAKALNQRLTENTVYTRFAEMIGTPLYMSPEQAEMSGLDIDTRSDIYSLGVLLYELLTGTTPFDRKRLAAAALDEIRRIIREEEPPKPSMRLSQSADALPSIAAQRKTEPAKLSKLLRGDLDWIVMKCLEKDRTRRYETASGLGRDVQRYLADEPVEACPPSAGYRLRKLVGRHKKSLTVAAAFSVLLISGAVVSAWQAVRATRAAEAARRARDAETQQRTLSDQRRVEAETAKEAETQQRRLADVRRAEAQNALKSAETNLYFHQIALAERYWFANNVARTEQVLESCPPALRQWEWHYLKRLCHPELMTLRGNGLTYSPDGEWLATVVKDSDGKGEVVKLWNSKTGKEIATIGHVPQGIYNVAFSPDGRKVAAACADRVVRVWEVPGGKQVLSIKEHESPFVVQVAFSPDELVSHRPAPAPNNFRGGLQPDELCIWDSSDGKQLHRFKDAGLCVAFSPDGQHLAAYRWQRVGPTGLYLLRVWDTATGNVVFTHSSLPDENESHGTIIYSPDGKLLVTGQDDKIKLWDAKNGHEVRILATHETDVFAFSPDGQQLASSGRDQTIRVWDVSTGQQRHVYRGHQGSIHNLAFSPKNHRLASAAADQTVRIWDTRQPQGARQIPGISRLTPDVTLSPDHTAVASITSEQLIWDAVSLSDANTGKAMRTLGKSFALPGASRDSLKYSPDGTRLAVTRRGGAIEVWEIASGKRTTRLQGRADRIRALAFSHDGQRLASFGAEEPTLGPEGMRRPRFDQDRTVRLWDVETGQELMALNIKRMRALALSFSPDGQRLAVAGVAAPKGDLVQPGIVQVWDLATRQVVLQLGGPDGIAHPIIVADVTFSSDGRHLATASWDSTVKIWNAADGKELFHLRGHTNYVYGIAFSPDSRRLASVGINKFVKIWDVDTGVEVLTLETPGGGTNLSFRGDGHQLALITTRDKLLVWDATPMAAP